ncbi:MAG: LCP family protein [Oscillospiraceae bacterium]|jgi:LCP family protein required for cell wall assembly|nr:LCP family protein [Oscillospiraceae bacterium]
MKLYGGHKKKNNSGETKQVSYDAGGKGRQSSRPAQPMSRREFERAQAASRNEAGRRQQASRDGAGRSYSAPEPAIKRPKKKRSAGRIALRVGIVVVSFVAVVVVAGALLIKYYQAPPPQVDFTPQPVGTDVETPHTSDGQTASATPPIANPRKEGVYSFFVLGQDKVSGLTDAVMICTLDTVKYTLEIVNIPRDTLTNNSWSSSHKINSIYNHYYNKSTKTYDDTAIKKEFQKLTGYPFDFYICVDIEGFIKIIDSVGGIDYTADKALYYNDPEQNLLIDIKKGTQHLDGYAAMGLVRARKMYANGDIGRVKVQQDFLKTLASQLLKKKSDIKLGDLASVVFNNVHTSLDLKEINWFAQTMQKLDSENIHFTLIPERYNDSFNGSSHCTIYVMEWLDIINKKLNPMNFEIEITSLSVLTRDKSGALYVTDGNIAGSSSVGGYTIKKGTKTPAVAPDSVMQGIEGGTDKTPK